MRSIRAESTSTGTQVNCAGKHPRFNSITLDGVSHNDRFGLNNNGYSTATGMPFPYDAIQQVSVELAPFDPKYGGFSACNINAVTKSAPMSGKPTHSMSSRPEPDQRRSSTDRTSRLLKTINVKRWASASVDRSSRTACSSSLLTKRPSSRCSSQWVMPGRVMAKSVPGCRRLNLNDRSMQQPRPGTVRHGRPCRVTVRRRRPRTTWSAWTGISLIRPRPGGIYNYYDGAPD